MTENDDLHPLGQQHVLTSKEGWQFMYHPQGVLSVGGWRAPMEGSKWNLSIMSFRSLLSFVESRGLQFDLVQRAEWIEAATENELDPGYDTIEHIIQNADGWTLYYDPRTRRAGWLAPGAQEWQFQSEGFKEFLNWIVAKGINLDPQRREVWIEAVDASTAHGGGGADGAAGGP